MRERTLPGSKPHLSVNSPLILATSFAQPCSCVTDLYSLTPRIRALSATRTSLSSRKGKQNRRGDGVTGPAHRNRRSGQNEEIGARRRAGGTLIALRVPPSRTDDPRTIRLPGSY